MPNFSRRLLASIAVAAAPVLPAAAADYDPPIFIEKAPEYVPVEVGSGWYLRGDVSYNVDSRFFRDGAPVRSPGENEFGGTLGVGYHFTDYLRGEVNLGKVGRHRYTYSDADFTARSRSENWSGLVHLYADLGTFAGFTPFVGAGAGVLYTRSKGSVIGDDIPAPITTSWKKDEYEFAYALAAGVNYRFDHNISVDLAYQFLTSPDAGYYDAPNNRWREGADYHQIKFGIRYNLW